MNHKRHGRILRPTQSLDRFQIRHPPGPRVAVLQLVMGWYHCHLHEFRFGTASDPFDGPLELEGATGGDHYRLGDLCPRIRLKLS